MQVKHHCQEKIYRGKLGADRPTLIGQLGGLGNERFLQRAVAGLAGLAVSCLHLAIFHSVNIWQAQWLRGEFLQLTVSENIDWEGVFNQVAPASCPFDRAAGATRDLVYGSVVPEIVNGVGSCELLP